MVACRQPSTCGSLSRLDCSTCYRLGGLVDPSRPLLCYCEATDVYSVPSGTNCADVVPLCNGTFVCDPSCYTCLGPNATQCLSCANPNNVFFSQTQNSGGSCITPCQVGQYIDWEGVCQYPNCSALSNCNGEGNCVWDPVNLVSACSCNTNFNGSDCSIVNACPTLDNCSGHGSCALNRITTSVYCICTLGWSGPSCSIQETFSYSPKTGPEIGGTTITIFSSLGFNSTDKVTCTFGSTNFTAFISPPLAYCTTPPYYAGLVNVPFKVYLDGNATAAISSIFSYVYSNLLPYSTQTMQGITYTVGTAKSIVYTTKPPYTQGLSNFTTIQVHVYVWNYASLESDGSPNPVLQDLGVWVTAPNNGTVSVTFNSTFAFSWTSNQQLYVISIQAGPYFYNTYAYVAPQNSTQQCDYFLANAPPSGSVIDACDDAVGSSSFFSLCSSEAVIDEPPILSTAYNCYYDDSEQDKCYIQVIGTTTYLVQTYEPYMINQDSQDIVLYFVSTQLPKQLCCAPGLSSTACKGYLALRTIFNSATPGKRSSPSTKPQYALALAYGSTHFETPDGLHFTFNAIGEFNLLQDPASNFTIQIRLTQLNGIGNASFVSAIAIQYMSSVLGIHLDQYGSYLLALDGVVQTQNPALGTLVILDGGYITITLQTTSNLHVYLYSGMIVDVSILDGALALEILVPTSFLGTLSNPAFTGLLGRYDGLTADDFLPQNGTFAYAVNSTTMELQDFGESWRLTRNQPLFLYVAGDTTSSISDPSFVPDYPETVGSNAQLSLNALQICQGATLPDFESDCYFDILMAGKYAASVAASTMGRTYDFFLNGNIPPPTFSTPPPSVVPLYLNTAESVPFSVDDSTGNEFTVFVSSKPLPNGILTASEEANITTYTYTFTVTGALWVDSTLPELSFTAVDIYGGTTRSVVALQTAYSTCAQGINKVIAEASLELSTYCPTSANTCSDTCRPVIARIAALSCSSQLVLPLGSNYTTPWSLCCDGSSIACPPPSITGLSAGALVGIVVGGVIGVGLLIAAPFIYKRYKKGNMNSGLFSRKEAKGDPDEFDMVE